MQTLNADTDLEALDRELLDLTSEEQDRVRKTERARSLERAIADVRAAEHNLSLLQVEQAKYDTVLTALKRIQKAVEQIPEATVGARLSQGVRTPAPELVDDLGAFLHDLVNVNRDLIEQRRDRTAASVQATEDRLAQARERARQLQQ